MNEKRKLSSFPNILSNVNSLSADEDACSRLHEILYSSPGFKSTRKSRILSWKIGNSDKVPQGVRETELSTVLKEICATLDLDIPEGRPNVETAIINFLCGKKVDVKMAKTPDENAPKKKGRKLGGRNRPKHVIAAEQAAKINQSYKRRGRVSKTIDKPVKEETKADSGIGKRGRPRKYREPEAFRQFVRTKYPEAVKMWDKMTGSQRANFWSLNRSEPIDI